jgi:hypothetical protein
VPGLIGFALEDTCKDVVPSTPLIEDGVEYMANMITTSNRTDWTYIVIGGQTSLAKLIREYPDAAASIENLVIMGGSFCAGFHPYPGVTAPNEETNIGCDINSANFVLDSNNHIEFPNVYYSPVVTAAPLSGNDYKLITDAAIGGEGKAAKATLDFYKAWSAASRSKPDLLVYLEAMAYDPATESTPQFDAVAVLVAMDVVLGNANARLVQKEFANGVHFITNDEVGVAEFTGQPMASYTLWTGTEETINDDVHLSNRCKAITPFHFDPADIKEDPVAIKAVLGYVSNETQKDFFHEMARRMSGTFNATSVTFDFDSVEENASSSTSNSASVSFLFLLPLFVIFG